MRSAEHETDALHGFKDGDRAKMVLGIREYPYCNWIAEHCGIPGVDEGRMLVKQNVLEVRRRELGY